MNKERDKDETDEIGRLIKLAKSDKKEKILELLEQGININIQRENSDTAASILAHTNDIEALKILISCGADINIPDNGRMTPLIHAAINKNKEAIQLLINNGANINSKRNDGMTALIIAADQGDIESIQLLLNSGSDPSIIDSNGYNAFQYTKARSLNTIANIIIDQMILKAIGELFFDRKDVHLPFEASEIIGKIINQGLQEAEIIESLNALKEKGYINYRRGLGFRPNNELILKYYHLYHPQDFNELYYEVVETLLEHFANNPGQQLYASSFKGNDFRHQLIGLLFEYFKRENYITIAIEKGFGYSALSLTSNGSRYFKEIKQQKKDQNNFCNN